jgi:hypothetical protein
MRPVGAMAHGGFACRHPVAAVPHRGVIDRRLRHPGGVRVGMGGNLGLRQRHLIALTAGTGDQLGQLLAGDHAFVNLDVSNFVLGVKVDPGHVGIGLELLLDRAAAFPARDAAGRDDQGCEPVGRHPVGAVGRARLSVVLLVWTVLHD